MTQSDDKERWKEEAQLLKKDLQSRPKTIQKREVPIQFPNPNQSKNKKPSPKSSRTQSKKTTASDDHLRQLLGL